VGGAGGTAVGVGAVGGAVKADGVDDESAALLGVDNGWALEVDAGCTVGVGCDVTELQLAVSRATQAAAATTMCPFATLRPRAIRPP
jgi:hypothetical protein